MISSIFYNGDGSTRIFPVAFKINGEDYVRVYVDNVEVIDRTKYDIINNSIVFTSDDIPAVGTDNIKIYVATSASELGDLGAPLTDITNVSNNLAEIVAVSTQVIPNLPEILLADNNATIATTQANLAIAAMGAAEASEGVATTQAGIATTQAGIAVTNAGLALTYKTDAESARDIAVASKDTAVTKASEVSTSASNALTSRNEAEGFRDEAEVFASSIDPSKLSPLSIPASRLLAGDITVTNTIVTQGMNTTLYTGNGSTQSITTGIDMNTQWGNDASERFGGLVWLKSSSGAYDHTLIDTIRGDNRLYSNLTSAEVAGDLIDFTSTGINLKSNSTLINSNLATYASWNFQTTHRTSGITNHGKAYTCHYNPFTGFTIVKYAGSSTAGHEIPHHLGRKLGFVIIKNLGATENWQAHSFTSGRGELNPAIAFVTENAGITDTSYISNSGSTENGNGVQYILYGWANSFYDDKGILNGNYEIGTYVGTGVAGNKVTTRGKPAWVMIKRLDSTEDWLITDNRRGDNRLFPNGSSAEISGDLLDISSDSFYLKGTSLGNTSGGTYLNMVAYDTNANGGGTYYPRTQDTSMLQLSDAQLMYSDGYANGTAKNTSEVLSGMTYPSVTYMAGYNYVKKTSGGGYSATPYEPKFGVVSATSDYYIDGKWYSSVGTPLGNIIYLPIKVLADASGQIVSAESWKYPEVVAEVMAVSRLPELPKHVANREYVDGVALGVNQTWQEMLGNRAAGVTYTNTTGKPIALNILALWATGTSFNVQIYIDERLMGRTQITGNSAAFYTGEGNIVVPHGAKYRVVVSNCTLASWLELR